MNIVAYDYEVIIMYQQITIDLSEIHIKGSNSTSTTTTATYHWQLHPIV